MGGAAVSSHLRLIPAQGISSGCCQAGSEWKKSRSLAGRAAPAGKAIGGEGDKAGGTERGGGPHIICPPPAAMGLGDAMGVDGRRDRVPVTPSGVTWGGGVRGPPPGPHGPSGTAGTVVVPPVPVPVPPPRGINSPGAACGGHRAKNSPGGTVVAGACRGHPSTAQYTQYGPVHPVTVAQQLPVLHSPSSSPVRSPSHSPQ